jgi:glycosyltransferase involved in cell wall biosynthesis
MKTLALTRPMHDSLSVEALHKLEDEDAYPRVTLLDRTLGTEKPFTSEPLALPPPLRPMRRFIPDPLVKAWFAYQNRRSFDVILTWGETYAVAYALVLAITRSKDVPHVAFLGHLSYSRVRLFLRLCRSRIDHVITWTSVQRDYAVSVLSFPQEKVTFVPHWVDQRFFRPERHSTDRIASAGYEMRDYHTLVEAMRDLPIPCQIATDAIRVYSKGLKRDVVRLDPSAMPPNVTVGKLPYKGLRELYARSRFVVVPLLPSEIDNGINTILEAMAMGKAVICSRTVGQVDAVKDGAHGFLVPPQNAPALREKILWLWEHPGLAEAMGREGRKHVEERHTVEAFVAKVAEVVQSVIDGRKGQVGFAGSGRKASPIRVSPGRG